MTYRVLQWATGNVGRAAIEGVLGHPELELAGCWVHTEAKDGQDVGTLSGAIRSGSPRPVTSTRCSPLEADCVVYSPIFADPTWSSGSSSRQERRDAARLVLPAGRGARPARRRLPRAGVSRCTAPASTPAGSPSASR